VGPVIQGGKGFYYVSGDKEETEG